MKRRIVLIPFCWILILSLITVNVSVGAATTLVSIPGWEGSWISGNCDPMNFHRATNVDYWGTPTTTMYMYKGGDVAGNTYICLTQTIDPSKIVPGHSYRLKYGYKLTVNSGGSLNNDASYNGSGWTDGWSALNNTGGSWQPGGQTTTAASTEYTVKFIIQGKGVRFWLCDMKLYDTSDPTETNLLVNSDFTQGMDIPCAEVTDASATPEDGQASLSWTNPNVSNYAKACIYNADTSTKLTEVNNPSSSAVITGLANGSTYNFKITTVTYEGVESSGVIVSANLGGGVTPSPEPVFGMATVSGWEGSWVSGNCDPMSFYRDRNVDFYGNDVTAMYIYKGGNVADNTYVCLSQTVDPSKIISGHSYRLKYAYRTIVESGGTLSNDASYNGSGWADGWSTFINTNGNWQPGGQTVTAASTSYSVKFMVQGKGVKLWLHEVSLYDTADQSQTNLLTNADFLQELDTPCADVTNTAATPGDGSLTVSWTNPMDSDLYKIRIYNTDTDTLLSETDKTVNSVLINGLVNNSTYRLKITTLDIEGNESQGVILIASPSSDSPTPTPIPTLSPYGKATIPGWTNSFVSGNCDPMSFYRDKTIKYGENTCSMYMYKGSNVVSNTYICLSQTINPSKIIAGHTYQLSYVYRTVLDSGGSLSNDASYNGVNWSDGYCRLINTNGNWQSGGLAVTASNGSQYDVKFIIDGKGAHFWLGNVTLYDVADPNQTNLLANADFTNGLDIPCADITNPTATGKDEAINLSWTNPTDSDFTAVRIYNAETNQLIWQVNSEDSSATLEGLTNGTTYNLKIVTVDIENNESQGIFVSATPLPPNMKVTVVSFSTSYLQAGEVTAVTNVKNNGIAGGADVSLILVLKKNGIIYDISGVKVNVPKTPYYADMTQLSSKIIVPNDMASNNYILEAFVWGDIVSMKPYLPVSVLVH